MIEAEAYIVQTAITCGMLILRGPALPQKLAAKTVEKWWDLEDFQISLSGANSLLVSVSNMDLFFARGV